MAHIEERVEELERIVQALHGLVGHKWHRGDGWPRIMKECRCGASEMVEREEYDALPTRWQLDSEF